MGTFRRLVALTVLAAVLGAPAATATAAGEVVRNPGDPYYEARLRASQNGRVWTGRISISFTNVADEPLGSVYFRLWSNGVDGCAAGAIEVWDLTGGTLGPAALDCTEVPVILSPALGPGDRATLTMRLRVTLPRRSDRFGYSGGLALVGTALPTLEVHDDEGWHHDLFEDLGESFYSVTGRYRVTLVGPPDLDTPATGTLAASKPLPNGLVARTYAAEGVRDFAWAAGRLEQLSGNSGPTKVVVSYRAASVTKMQAQRMLVAAQKSLSTFSAAFGAYPYPELDVVLGAFPGFGGMEYPTIVFSEVNRYTVAHEIAHQWWYGVVGNDQYADPWLDESLATWSEELPWGAWVGCASYDFPGAARLSNDMGYWGDHPNQYDTVYDGGGCMLANLAKRFGAARFLDILSDYAAAHWLGVARPEDLTALIEEAAVQYGVPFAPDAFWAAWRVDTP
ncbi:MAG: M1 family metallopeptidase [Acidimicrobiia bacterium]|nr:M1 family metallopeptidase [Acidimicrobiia bacterium]